MIKNKIIVSLILFLSVSLSCAQEYKNPKAYMLDFSKNEAYINSAMIEYSKSIIQQSPEYRKSITLNKLIDKLKEINQILINTYKGFKNDITLKEAFINLNDKIIYCLTNDCLNLKDYELQCQLSNQEIRIDFAQKENNIKLFFEELKKYDNFKSDFALKYNIVLKTRNKKNVFEYNAIQNFIFYKLNVFDGKLTRAIESKNITEIINANESLLSEAYKTVNETTLLEDQYTDQTLNNANKKWIDFLIKQSDEMVQKAIKFFNFYNDFQKVKEATAQSNDSIIIDQYNAQVKTFNQLKNSFFEAQNQFQIQKEQLRNEWFNTNSQFLINNIDLDKINTN